MCGHKTYKRPPFSFTNLQHFFASAGQTGTEAARSALFSLRFIGVSQKKGVTL
jgi:hypothetical protein